MKLLLSLSLLVILLGGCSTQDDGGADSSLSDMYDTESEEETEDSEVVDEEEIPDSIGPTDIPDDLIPSR